MCESTLKKYPLADSISDNWKFKNPNIVIYLYTEALDCYNAKNQNNWIKNRLCKQLKILNNLNIWILIDGASELKPVNKSYVKKFIDDLCKTNNTNDYRFIGIQSFVNILFGLFFCQTVYFLYYNLFLESI